MSNINKENLKQAQGSIFDKNGKHLLDDYRPKVKTQISIDFFDETVKAYIVYPKRMQPEKSKGSNKQLLDTKRNQLILRKMFKIADDYRSVCIEKQSYNIPTFYNTELLKKEDEKIWQMIFYEIFAKEIQTALNNANIKSTKKEQHEILNTSE